VSSPALARHGAPASLRARRSAADADTLRRIRARLSGTVPEERALRVFLVLAHEVVRSRVEGSAQGKEDAPRREADDSAFRTAPADDYAAVVSKIHEVVAEKVPPGAALLVVSRGDDALLAPGYRATHFPQAKGGGYAGFHPADTDAAIEHLELLRSAGAEFILFPATVYWWLEYYAGLASHLLTTARTVVHDESCLLFDLRPRAGGRMDT
jgi:hypothetical protein